MSTLKVKVIGECSRSQEKNAAKVVDATSSEGVSSFTGIKRVKTLTHARTVDSQTDERSSCRSRIMLSRLNDYLHDISVQKK